jgi:hypothetical protein
MPIQVSSTDIRMRASVAPRSMHSTALVTRPETASKLRSLRVKNSQPTAQAQEFRFRYYGEEETAMLIRDNGIEISLAHNLEALTVPPSQPRRAFPPGAFRPWLG